ncbi:MULTISPECIES: hypothetical protein [Streptomyces]|uniref:Extensin n=1 Tax=Streptomyces lycii TaxID=2654337 RepID=A0ABQ7FGG7_9ACTN|nr:MULTISPECIES: hypothetical protein [Streptomyces]KAF4408136.1 hypothetical protein GCU69_15895 [Streptomyces lycii]PGH51171.1 hypothetical protein CRI70_08140 [Streptomyces sp. Ru87]
MAEEGFSWLDEDATERLLRGEPADALPAVGPEDLAAQARARRLAAALGSVSAPSLLVDGDGDGAAFPGEAAALAAFREARAGARQETAAAAGGHAPGAAPDAPYVPAPRGTPIGRKVIPGRRFRLGRPLRAGLSVALAGCALGGVAFAAGANVLSPFDAGRPEHEPRRSASAEATPSPLTSGEASAGTEHGGPDGDGRSSAPPSSTGPGGDGRDGESPGNETERGSEGDRRGGVGIPPGIPDTEQRREAVAALCRRYEAGNLEPDTERRLENAAGGPEAVERYCGKLAGTGTGVGGGDTGGSGSGEQNENGQGGNGGNGEEYDTRDGSGEAGSGGRNDTGDGLPSTGRLTPDAGKPGGATQGDDGAGATTGPGTDTGTEPDGATGTDTDADTGAGADPDSGTSAGSGAADAGTGAVS